MKNTIGILSYNMPNLTDTLVEQIKELVKIPYELIVFDNGSDSDKVSKNTTNRKDNNTRLTGGMNAILDLAKGSDNVWLCTNDIAFKTDNDPLESLLNKLDGSIGCIHPSLIEPVSNYAYRYMLTSEGKTGVTKGHPMVDIICPLYTKKALDLNDWQFDSRFVYGWGIDYDSCLKLRRGGLEVAVDFDIVIAHQTSITYDSGKDKEFKNRHEYYGKAMDCMNSVMVEKYGANWRRFFQ